jgi:hypothetical protein
VDSEYLRQLAEWLIHVERRFGARAANEDETMRELRDAIGAAQVAVARMLAELRLSA